jgi:transglutaminase-like putative cysteine protease
MSIHVALRHITTYTFDRPVSLAPHVVRLRPAPHCRTPVLAYSLKIEPAKHFINWQQDPQSNHLARLMFPEKTTSLTVEVELVAEMSVYNPFDFFLEPEAERLPLRYDPDLVQELAPFHVRLPATPRFASLVERVRKGLMKPDGGEGARTVDFLVGVNQLLNREIRYVIRLEPGVQAPDETLTRASGSCRDTGWLLVQLLRHLGFAARFVSGYLIQLTPDVKSLDGPSGTEKDFTDLHAWCEVYLPGAGWIGLDPTSGLLAGEGHIPLACSPEPGSAAPISGGLTECKVEFEHSMSVRREWEAPRVTLPYSDEQWEQIQALGHEIDGELTVGDVRLTQGGEPTFVSIDDRDGVEWNTEALGERKRVLAGELLARLKEHYAPQGLRHFGQGKWYPGEQLPRWSLNLFWRKDGQPLWTSDRHFARETDDHGATEAQAHAFLHSVAARLAIDPKHMMPAYEDTWYYLWRERRLPTNVDPFDSRLADPLERERLRRIFSNGLDAVVGHVLPVSKPFPGSRWQSGRWFLRDERCYLVPGDSPIGYRLPLNSQPWVTPGDYVLEGYEPPRSTRGCAPSRSRPIPASSR